MKLVIFAALLFLSNLANAITITGTVGTAGSGATATDSYWIACAKGTTQLKVFVRDEAPVKIPRLRIRLGLVPSIGNIGGVTPYAYDTVDGDAAYSTTPTSAYNPIYYYYVEINKEAYTGTLADHKGAESYSSIIQCYNSSNVAVQTAVSQSGNQ